MIINSNSLKIPLKDKSVNCVVTSPPYWGLRDYGVDGQLGLEETPEEYVENMVTVFREVWRVLRDDGTLWLNLGDSYSGIGKGGQSEYKLSKNWQPKYANEGNVPIGFKPKDLIGIPWMVAFVLRNDGWYLRSDIIWSKPNPMPESVTDRPTKSHEYLFLLSKSKKYYYDQESICEPVSPNTHARLAQNVQAQIGTERENGGTKSNGNFKACGRKFDPNVGNKNNMSFDQAMAIMPRKRNKRTVWEVTTQGYKEAHFATFPEKLVVDPIKAGCPEGGVVLDPFGGSGTVKNVAERLGRKAIVLELKFEYCQMAKRRCERLPELF